MQLTHLRLKTNRLEAMKAFYNNLLQIPVNDVTANHFSLITTGTTLTFERVNTNDNPIYHFAFSIPAGTIEAAANWLAQRTNLIWIDDFNPFIADFVNWNAKSVYFKDPSGNIAEFIARNIDGGIEAGLEFSAALIQKVCEIGLVFSAETFEQEVEHFMTTYSLTYFDRQPLLPHFRAVGDEDGLLIAVPASRPWYPTTNVFAALYPVGVTCKNNGMPCSFQHNSINY